MGFSRQEYWSGLTFPPLGYLPYPGIKPVSLVSSALAGGFFFFSFTTSATQEAPWLEQEKQKLQENSFSKCWVNSSFIQPSVMVDTIFVYCIV